MRVDLFEYLFFFKLEIGEQLNSTAGLPLVNQLNLCISVFSQCIRVQFVLHFPPVEAKRDAGWLPPLSFLSLPFFYLFIFLFKQIPQKRHKSVRGEASRASKAQQAEGAQTEPGGKKRKKKEREKKEKREARKALEAVAPLKSEALLRVVIKTPRRARKRSEKRGNRVGDGEEGWLERKTVM